MKLVAADGLAEFYSEDATVRDAADPQNVARGHDAIVARARQIRTPSANQVRRGLTREGFGQWKGYERQLAPVLPILEPWVRYWGYER